jgi:hypothetical protein
MTRVNDNMNILELVKHNQHMKNIEGFIDKGILAYLSTADTLVNTSQQY